MGCGKTIRFKTEDGRWRSGKHYSPRKMKKEEEEDHEHDHEHPETEKKTQNDSVWSKPKYYTDKYEGYIHYLTGKEKEFDSDLFNKKITVSCEKF